MALGRGNSRGKSLWKMAGLAKSELFEQRDLKVTTDFREVIAQILASQFKLNSQQMGRVFPDFTPTQTVSLL